MPPTTAYARSGETSIAYQVAGTADRDLVMVPGFVSHLELGWREPTYARFLERLARFSRLITFDKRGTGLSDRVAGRLPTLEERMDDVRAVMDAVGSARATLFGVSEGGPMSVMFATSHPDRTERLVLYGSYARRVRTKDYPWAPTAQQHRAFLERTEREWGGPVGLETWAPSMANSPRFAEWWAEFLRLGASPGSARALLEMALEIDVRDLLPSVRVPTLVLSRADDRRIRQADGEYLARSIPGATFVSLPGEDHLPWVGDADRIADEIEQFMTGELVSAEPRRVLATVLFTDIVDSTATAARLGDRAWNDLLAAHHAAMRREVQRFGGREIDTAGDGFFVTFDGPARGVRCACAMRDALRRLGLELRAGLHIGEVEIRDDGLAGIAVHTGARVAATATAGQILVTSTIRDLVGGSGLTFRELGERTFKGVPGSWLLLEVVC